MGVLAFFLNIKTKAFSKPALHVRGKLLLQKQLDSVTSIGRGSSWTLSNHDGLVAEHGKEWSAGLPITQPCIKTVSSKAL